MAIPRLLVFLTSAVAVFGVDRLPVEDFARTQDISRMTLSPDGGQAAYLADHHGITKLLVVDFSGKKTVRLNLGQEILGTGRSKEVGWFNWVGNRRVMLSTLTGDLVYGVLAMNSDGGKSVGISGYERTQDLAAQGGEITAGIWAREVLHTYFDADANVLMLDRHDRTSGSFHRPDVLKVDTRTGSVKTLVENPGKVTSYGVDFNGTVRFGVLMHGDSSGAIYRDSEKAPWRTILPLKDRRGALRTLGFDAGGNRVLVTALTADKRWAPFALDPAKAGELGEPLLADAEYDIIPERFIPSMDAVPLAGPIFSRTKQSLIGMRYYTESARIKWFDPEFANYQRGMDKAHPNTVNLLVNQSLDGKKLLWFSYSDQDPGYYTLLDVEKRALTPVGPRMPWIKPAQMASTLSIKYPARDGLVIPGYLTVPVGYQPKDLPLVVLVHGGPWVRDIWGFDPFVQLLANRGYAVLQMNYRGSTGYGEELYRQARREIGGKIQNDIEDGVRWAIAAGIAKPTQIAIMGGSYGGYSALFALGRNPELYRCGISFAGVTDWPAMYKESDVKENKAAKRYWSEQIGDPGKEQDMEKLRTVSPVNFAGQITAPVLIMQGKEDQRVPQEQAKRMIDALEAAGRKPASLFIAKLGHNYGDERQRTQIFKAVVAFLEKNLGPGVP